ncbi:amino acid adenylation domain-containing protein [Streptomyces sp. NPDC096132]|uniref:amino acid adenylation domain-containing protein n=1 Tax=Streptomyces sp. NPDC096132 TaxID=3366075 RepID=UPI0038207C02
MHELIVTERAQAIHRMVNSTDAPYPDDCGVKELFEACAEEHPGATAVVHAGRALTYRQLNSAANALAARLRQTGVRPGDTVAVCLVRSPELVVALVAIIKCAAVYLPLDAAWPDERLRTVLGQASCRWTLSDAPHTLAERFPECRALGVDEAEAADGHVENPALRVDPDDIAYINFTSGSTGVPKGVPVRHRSIARLVFGARYAHLGERTTLLHMAPVTFDAATFEIWGALLHGGTCVLYPFSFVRLSKLRQVIEAHGVTVLFLTTALFNTVVDEAPETLDGLETVLTGGEAHSLTHMSRAVRRYGPGRVVSVYGPTECTTFATYYPVPDPIPTHTALPIGLPLQNTRLYLVHDGHLCEPGELGEICLSGPGLSPGYLHAWGATRRQFIECEIDGTVEMLYRTGDRGYFLDDGNVVFKGRLDDQVKVNGYRIEIGEVSHHLDRHPDIKQSYVTVSGDTAGQRTLLAFIVPCGEDCTSDAIREYLGEHLPVYMIPAKIHFCGSLPLSATGKVDRHALMSLHAPSGVTSS